MPFDGLEEKFEHQISSPQPVWRNLYSHPVAGQRYGMLTFTSKESAFAKMKADRDETPSRFWMWPGAPGGQVLKSQTTAVQVRIT